MARPLTDSGEKAVIVTCRVAAFDGLRGCARFAANGLDRCSKFKPRRCYLNGSVSGSVKTRSHAFFLSSLSWRSTAITPSGETLIGSVNCSEII
jgi:hypothetical protein